MEEEENDENISAEERAMLKQICGFCKGGPEKNKYGEDEDLLSCNDCGNSGKCLSSINLTKYLFHSICTWYAISHIDFL